MTLKVEGTEQAYAVDSLTGGVLYLGTNIKRAYRQATLDRYGREPLPTEWHTSLDLEATTIDGLPLAEDYKTGQRLKSASELWQIRLQCYALAVKYDAPAVWGRVSYIAEDGSVSHDAYLFSRMELNSYPAKLEAIRAQICAAQGVVDAGGMPTVHTGAGCNYCPAAVYCPAQTALARAMVTTLEDIDAQLARMTPEQLARAHELVQQADKIVKRVRKGLNVVVGQHPVPLGNGYELRSVQQSRPYINADLVRGLLLKRGATEQEIAGITKTTTFPTIRREKVK